MTVSDLISALMVKDTPQIEGAGRPFKAALIYGANMMNIHFDSLKLTLVNEAGLVQNKRS